MSSDIFENMKKLKQKNQSLEDENQLLKVVLTKVNNDVVPLWGDLQRLKNGTVKKTVSQLKQDNVKLRSLVTDLHWMARRYANGRKTVSVPTVNDATRSMIEMTISIMIGTEQKIFARDGQFSFSSIDEQVEKIYIGTLNKFDGISSDDFWSTLHDNLREYKTNAIITERKHNTD